MTSLLNIPLPDRVIGVEQRLRMYQTMLKIRLFEHQVVDLYTRALMPGLAHLYVGEEAIAVGVCEALEVTDYITSTHRGHGHCLAKGAKLDGMFCELLGKEAGYCKGKGGSMHIADPATGNLGANAIVGGSAGIATGAAFSAKRLGTGQVAVCFFGEGALGQGVLYEVMNMAALWKLPVIYVCENNMYNEYTHYLETTAGDILTRVRGFGVHPESVDGQDVGAVFGATSNFGGSSPLRRRPLIPAGKYLPVCRTSCRRRPAGLLPNPAGGRRVEDRTRPNPSVRRLSHRAGYRRSRTSRSIRGRN